MATTANVQSSRVSDIQIITSLQIDENNGAETNANAETPASGLFIVPSTVAGRAADVTGFLVTSENEYGKLQFSDPDGFLSLTELSDVTITTPAANESLVYNGTTWVNQLAVPSGTATLVAGTVTVLTADVLDTDTILVTLNTPGGTTGTHYSVPVASIVDGTSFVINAVDTAGDVVNTDTSTINWALVRT